MSKRDEMKKIRDELFEFKDSPLYSYRTENKYFPVIGEGSHDASIVFIGEAPGKKEAQTGRPFCGASGKVLDQLLDHISVKREDVYITNIVKDRPQHNRDPKPEEIKLYAPFLQKQLEVIQPHIIATLGRFSMEYILKEFGLEDKIQIISKIHGEVFEAKASWGSVKIIPLYHPAVAVYNRTQLDMLKKDFELLKID
jgi:uracil-DNA glycosylase